MISLIALFAVLILSGIAGAIAAIFMFRNNTPWPVYVEENTPATPGFGANIATPNLDSIGYGKKSYGFGC